MTTSAQSARTAIVTGASSGLGVEIACALGGLGWRVAVGARRVERLDDTAARVEEAGGHAFAHPLDVSDSSSIDAFFDASVATFGTPDVVVNNAGMSMPGLLEEHTPEALAYEVAVNLTGPMLVARRAIARLREEGRRGDLVFITSDAVTKPRPQQSPYTATKSGLEGLARALSMELEGSGIRSTIVRPGRAFSEYAAAWDHAKIAELIPYWRRYGLQRHTGVMAGAAVARAVVLAVTTPPGVHLDTIEVQPEAPTNA